MGVPGQSVDEPNHSRDARENMPARAFALSLACVVFTLVHCSKDETVTTPNGTFQVPGPARITGNARSLSSTRMESGCEIPGGGHAVTIERSRTSDGRTLFYIGRTDCPAGWIDARFVVPAGAAAATSSAAP